jgi:hypothetical protein
MEKFNLNDMLNPAGGSSVPQNPVAPSPNAVPPVTTSTPATPNAPRIIQGRAVTEEEKNGYRAMKAQGLSIKKIAEHYKRQPAVVYGHLKKMGLTKSATNNVENAAAAEGIKLQGTTPTSVLAPSQPAAAPQVPPVATNKPKNLLDLLGGGAK